jgi:hypothetical protein
MAVRNGIVVTYKYTDKMALTTKYSFIRDDLFRASRYGVAQYASHALTDVITLNAR